MILVELGPLLPDLFLLKRKIVAQLREGRLVSYYLLVKQRCSRKQKKGGEKCSGKRRVEIPEQC